MMSLLYLLKTFLHLTSSLLPHMYKFTLFERYLLSSLSNEVLTLDIHFR